ncbi:hypothetical protein O0I10_008681 [Lichtheimia ornata]|uniref:Uncharacterized protein n=1 Tax=Lichtheimia ornata TaxID=688661 RepID=A0AAD7UXR5_9FUNG|nr:uncharacterized protein O0I10_008681 [Lichtheimia ornata]KAJ8655593.1 hypothetical protein O0I10_008681 [Lichtheimia ornata]
MLALHREREAMLKREKTWIKALMENISVSPDPSTQPNTVEAFLSIYRLAEKKYFCWSDRHLENNHRGTNVLPLHVCWQCIAWVAFTT